MKFLNYHKSQYNKNGFTVVRNMFSAKEIKGLMIELEKVKIKVEKTKKKHLYHKTNNGKFNTIHNINKFHRRGEIVDLPKKKKIKGSSKSNIRGYTYCQKY